MYVSLEECTPWVLWPRSINISTSTEPRINDRIRAREVRLVGPAGEQLGIKPLPDALAIARAADLDLVEVAPNAAPPVCKVMDFGKFKYEQDQKRKESRRKATNIVIKEMKFRPKIDPNDYSTKMKHVHRFLGEGSKVKLTIMFRGREMAHKELGQRILERVAEEVAEIADVEQMPKLDGRNMTMVLNPKKKAPTKPAKTKGAPNNGAASAAEGAEGGNTPQADTPQPDVTPTPQPAETGA